MTASPGLGTPRAASPDLLRSVFRQHAAGVAVITAYGAGPVGFTATSLTSVAADPPLISFGIATGGSSWPAVAEAEHIGVHILGEHQQELAATFARSGADRFGPATAPAPRACPSWTAYWPGWCARSWRGCRPPITGSCSPSRSSATPRAPAALSSTTRAASTRCGTDRFRPAAPFPRSGPLARSHFDGLDSGHETGCTGE